MANDKKDYYKFFDDFLKEQSQDKYVVISKADNNGNYAMFMYLYNSKTNYSTITFADLFELLEYLQNHNIEIRFTDRFYQFQEKKGD